MGRLFWKFFSFIFLAQLLATLTIGGTFWLKDHNRTHRPPPTFHSHAMIQAITQAAASTLEFGGPAAFKTFIETQHMTRLIYAINTYDQDVLQRPLNPLLIERAKQLQEGQNTLPL